MVVCVTSTLAGQDGWGPARLWLRRLLSRYADGLKSGSYGFFLDDAPDLLHSLLQRKLLLYSGSCCLSLIGLQRLRYCCRSRFCIPVRHQDPCIAYYLRKGTPFCHYGDALAGHRLRKRDTERLPVRELAVDFCPAIPLQKFVLRRSDGELDVREEPCSLKGNVSRPLSVMLLRLIWHTVMTSLSFSSPGANCVQSIPL